MHSSAKALAAVLTLAAATPALASTQLVSNGGFETGDFTGWSVGYTSGNNVCCFGFSDTGTHVQQAGTSLPGPLGGTYAAYGDWDGGDANYPTDLNKDTDFWVRQSLTKTSDVTSATLSFQFAVAGGALTAYLANSGYGGEILGRNVTANFLGSDLSLKSNLYTFERAAYDGTGPYTLPTVTVTLDVTAAFNALDDGQFYLDFSRNIPQYFTGGGYFMMDNASLVVGDAVVPDPDPGPGIPEPGAWALMILGFGGTGAMLRRRLVSVGPVA